MRRLWMAALCGVLLGLAGPAGAGEPAAKPASPKALERFKALQGEWIAVEDGPMTKKGDVVARYHLTGADSAVVEEIFPGTEHAMTTVYYADGKDVALTHYCMAGNQPKMRAKDTAGSHLAFAFDGGTNIDPKTTTHMHQAEWDFVGENEIKSTWTEFEGGKPSMTVVMHLVRKTS